MLQRGAAFTNKGHFDENVLQRYALATPSTQSTYDCDVLDLLVLRKGGSPKRSEFVFVFTKHWADLVAR